MTAENPVSYDTPFGPVRAWSAEGIVYLDIPREAWSAVSGVDGAIGWRWDPGSGVRWAWEGRAAFFVVRLRREAETRTQYRARPLTDLADALSRVLDAMPAAERWSEERPAVVAEDGGDDYEADRRHAEKWSEGWP